MPSFLISNNMSFNRLYSSKIHTTGFDPKLSPTSPRGTTIQGKKKKGMLLDSRTKFIYEYITSIKKANTSSLRYFKPYKTNMSLPISLTEWITLCNYLPDFENDERFDACYHLIIYALLIL